VPNVLVVRGHNVAPWDLMPWTRLPDRYEVSYLLTPSNRFAAPEGLRVVPARALRDLFPSGSSAELLTALIGDRYLSTQDAFARADIVHAAELSFWFAAEAARRKRRHGFRLALTVWETLPLMATYRNRHARRYRELVLAETDLFLPVTERAAHALRLEGVEEHRMLVCPPGVDVGRFANTKPDAPHEHTIVSPGRQVWEKGHHDVLRALAALHRGLVGPPRTDVGGPRLLIVGSGPEERRLRAYAAELGLQEVVEVRGGVSYAEMPQIFARASAMVLASQSSATASYHPLGVPHAFWEEQFGMVLAEAMAAGLAIVATTSGAIPEVLAGTQEPAEPGAPAPAALVAPGDWMGIARALAAGPLRRPPGARVSYPVEIVQRYSATAAAERLAAAYDRLAS
jgi:glycosyltransferase involved in cell wall biosynthesis